MTSSADREIVGYSLNLFPSETVEQVLHAIEETILPLRRSLFSKTTMGVELRFGMNAIQSLSESDEELRRLRDRLIELGLLPFTLNGFPISDFHGASVKENVFRPTWLEEERVRATCRLGEIAVGLLGGYPVGSVSTLTGSFKEWGNSIEEKETVVRNLARVAEHYDRVGSESGKELLLCVEPEPLNTFENLAEVLEMYELIDRVGASEVRKRTGASLESSRELLRRVLCINYDTCHFSIQFEKPARTLRTLKEEGIRVGKIHLSNCLAISDPADNSDGIELLRTLDEPRYLHQVVGVDANGRVALRDRDLPDFLARTRAELESIREIRVHFHMPLFLEGGPGFSTTHEETAAAYAFAREEEITSHFAIETYTFGILMEIGFIPVRNLVEGISREFEWVFAKRVPAVRGE